VHWGLSGEPDRYGGRFEGLLLIPLVALGVYLLLLLLPRLDPRRAEYERFRGAYLVIRVAVVVLISAVYATVLLSALGVETNVPAIVPLLVGALLVVIGGVMGKLRPNWFVGIRTPWTLSSRLSWTKTHRLGGWSFVFMGLALVAAGLAGSASALVLALAFVFGCAVWLVAYSYLVWRGDPGREPPSAGARPTAKD
jgi:uncharacterized membrane protein